MKQTFILPLVAVTTLLNANDSYTSGEFSGQIRTAYASQNNSVDCDTYGTSIGGILKYETAEWNGVKFGVGAYISQKLPFASGEGEKINKDFFDKDGKSYLYAGEAYLDYTLGTLNLRVGRQLIDTPFADTDDIRMHPNTFEAALATYSGIDKTALIGGYITRWAGYDAPQGHNDSISQFQKFGPNHQSSGAAVVGILNESVDNLKTQGWVYSIDKLSNAFYTDGVYSIPFSETMSVELSAQYAHFSEKRASGMDGNAYGIGALLNIGALTLGTAYNKASNENDKSVSNGFGGGPYLTSMEEWTIDGYEDAKAYRFSAELDCARAGLEGLVLTALYGNFKSTPANMHVKEIDLVAAYQMNNALTAELSYAMIDDKNNNTAVDDLDVAYDGAYERLLIRINYRF